MIRQLFKTGNSTVVSLPKEILEELGLREGERINLELDKEQNRLILTPVDKSLEEAGVTQAFVRQVNEFIETYRPALEELAK